MKEYKVVIPKLKIGVIEFIQEDNIGLAYINVSLKQFQPKIVFAWHLSIWLELENCNEDGLPDERGVNLVDEYEMKLNSNLLGGDMDKPNAIFFGRIFWNKSCELIWRVYNAEQSNSYLESLIKSEEIKLNYDFRIDHDEEWKLAEWHLNASK